LFHQKEFEKWCARNGIVFIPASDKERQYSRLALTQSCEFFVDHVDWVRKGKIKLHPDDYLVRFTNQRVLASIGHELGHYARALKGRVPAEEPGLVTNYSTISVRKLRRIVKDESLAWREGWKILAKFGWKPSKEARAARKRYFMTYYSWYAARSAKTARQLIGLLKYAIPKV